MKKVMSFLAIMVIAGVASAASVTWTVGVGSVRTVDNSANLAGATIKLIAVANTSDLNAYITALANQTATSATTTFSGVNFVDTKTTAAGGNLALTTATSASLTAANSYNFYVVAFTTFTGNNYFEVSAVKVGTAYDPPTTPSGVSYTSANFGAAGSYTGINSTTDVNGWIQTVPEPTSLALLALGVAAVGLRRKFRK